MIFNAAKGGDSYIPRRDTETSSSRNSSVKGAAHPHNAVAAPYKRYAAPHRVEGQTTGLPDEPRNPERGGAVAAPIQGVMRDGRAFVLHRLDGPLTEFVVVFTTERR